MLELDKSGIYVAEYLTVSPPREVFQQKIHETMVQARLRVEHRTEGVDGLLLRQSLTTPDQSV